MDPAPEVESLTSRIIGAAIEVHRRIGPRLLPNSHAPVLKEGVTRMSL